MGRAETWKPVSVAILRMAGFPLDWLRELTDGGAVREADTILDLEDRLAAIWQWARRYPDVPEPDRAVLRRLRSGRPPRPVDEPPQDDVLAQQARNATGLRRRLAAVRRDFDEAYQADTSAGSAVVVQRFCKEPALLDALLVSNEGAAERLTSWLDQRAHDQDTWRTADRKALITLVRYLQRLCAKNDTTSHFGPFAVGAFTAAVEGVEWLPADLRRSCSLSRWAATAVAECLVPEAGWRPRRMPGAFLDDRRLQVVSIRHTLGHDVRAAFTAAAPVTLEADDARLLSACDGERTIADLARDETLASTHDVEALTLRLRRLHDLGAVELGPKLPYGVLDSLEAIRRLTVPDGGPDGAAARLDRLRGLLTGFAEAPYDRRRARLEAVKTTFTDLTGLPPRRDTRLQFYADHGLFSEDCLAPVAEMRFGKRIHSLVSEELAPLHDLLLLPARLRFDGERQLLAAWYGDRFGERRTSLGTYLTAFMADLDRIHAGVADLDSRIRSHMAGVEAGLLPDHEAGPDEPGYHRHRVDVEAIRAAARQAPRIPAMCSPDAMIIAGSADVVARGDFTVVVGDAHATEENLSHGMFSPHVYHRFPEFADEVVAGYRSMLEPGETIADVTQQHRNATFVRCHLPCLDIEAYDASPGAGRDVIRLFELEVAPGPGFLRLRHPASDRHIRLMAAPLAWCGLPVNPMDVFAFPSRVAALAAGEGREHVPRVVAGRVVLQRETWRIPVADLTAADHAATFLAFQRLRRRLALPRHVYAKIVDQPKPVYCDLDSPLLVRSLTGLLTPDHDKVEVSEMLPGPQDLWFEVDGQRRTSELRYTVFAGRTTP